MENYFSAWMFDSRILSNNALRMYLLVSVLERFNRGKSVPLRLNRKEFASRLGYSYNTTQSALSELMDLGLISFADENRNSIFLNPIKKFNVSRIMTLTIQLVDSSTSDEDAPKNDSEI